MNYYKIGCNFDFHLIDGIRELNEINDLAKVNEFYGSIRIHDYLTARPSFRLPDINIKELERYVKACSDAGIEFNYTLNSLYPGSKSDLFRKKQEIIDIIYLLHDIGVKTITISNPILAHIIRDTCLNIRLEVSTIAHIDTITQIKVWKDLFAIDKICCNILKNRQIKFLKKAALYCHENGIILDLIVNEFCNIGGEINGSQYSTHCIYRDSCYLCHSKNISKEDDNLFNSYPMHYCILSRKNPYAWLKSQFIRPEDIKLYNQIGINYFKITGRTGGTEYILETVKSYIQESLFGNLIKLWKPLETIKKDIKEYEFNHLNFIDNKKLSNFLTFWFNNENHDCANEICGETCTYCNDYYNNIINKN